MSDILVKILGDEKDLLESLKKSEDAASSFGSSLKGVGSKAGGALALGAAGGVALLGTAVAGVGISAFSTATDIESATKQIQSALGLTTEEAEKLGAIGTDVFENNFTASIGEATAAVGQTALQLKNISFDELQPATENALRLADAFGTDINQSLNAANVLMTQFDLTQQQAFDFMSSGFQQGLDTSGDFLESITEYGNLFGQAGADAGQFFSLLETGLQGGVHGTDRAADAFKEFSIRLIEGGDDAVDALGTMFGRFMDTSEGIEETAKDLEKLEKALSKAEAAGTPDLEKITGLKSEIDETASSLAFLEQINGKFVEGLIEFEGGAPALFEQLSSGALTTIEAFELVQQALAEVNDPIEKNALGVAIMGTQFEDLGANAVAGIDVATTSMDDLAGSTETLDAQYDTLTARMETIGRTLQTSLAPVGEVLVEMVEKALPAVESFVNFFAETGVPAITSFATAFQDSFANMMSTEGEGGGMFAGIKEAWNAEMLELADSDALTRISTAFEKIGTALGVPDEGTVLDLLKEDLANIEGLIGGGVEFLEGFATVMESIAGATESSAKFIQDFADGLSNITMPSALQSMIDKFEELKSSIPAWLIPGSPPPLFYALQDIGKAAGAMPDISASMGFNNGPDLEGVLNAPNMANAGQFPQSMGQQVINLFLSDGTPLATWISGQQGQMRQQRAAMGGATRL